MKFNDLNIEHYKDEDYECLIKLWTDIHLGGASRGDTPEIIADTIKNGGQLLVVSDQDGTVVGSSWLTTDKRRNYLPADF